MGRHEDKDEWVCTNSTCVARAAPEAHAREQETLGQQTKQAVRSKAATEVAYVRTGCTALYYTTAAAAVYSSTAVPHLTAENVASAMRAPSAQDLVGIIPLADTKKVFSCVRTLQAGSTTLVRAERLDWERAVAWSHAERLTDEAAVADLVCCVLFS